MTNCCSRVVKVTKSSVKVTKSSVISVKMNNDSTQQRKTENWEKIIKARVGNKEGYTQEKV